MSFDIFSLIYFNVYEVIESWEKVQISVPYYPSFPYAFNILNIPNFLF